MNYSKTLSSKKDYKDLEAEVKLLKEVAGVLDTNNIPYLNQHEHRMWEYGNALSAIKDKYGRRTKSVSVLDIGGAASLFGVTAASRGYQITQVDPGNNIHAVNRQNDVIDDNMTAIQQNLESFSVDKKYEVVTCLSVVEHVPDDLSFITKLGSFVEDKGLLIITTDFHPSGAQRLPWHIRTYNEKTFLNLKKSLEGFEYYGGSFDYSDYSEMVNNYTFAMMVLEKS